MRKLSAVVGLAAILAISGCGFLGGNPLGGSIYTDAKWPNKAFKSGHPGTKVGKATCTSYLGWFEQGDCSYATACKNGGVKTIATVDTHGTTVLGIVSTWTATCTGE